MVFSTHEKYDVFNTQDEKHLVFTDIKVNFLFILYNTVNGHFSIDQIGGENAKQEIFDTTNYFGYQIVPHALRKMNIHTYVCIHK